MNLQIKIYISFLLFATTLSIANPLTHVIDDAAKLALKNSKLAKEEAELAAKAAKESSALTKNGLKNGANSSLGNLAVIENSPYYANVVRMVNKCKQTQKRDAKIKDCESNAQAFEQCISYKINGGEQITKAQRKCESEFKI
jgi:hypothetical protein